MTASEVAKKMMMKDLLKGRAARGSFANELNVPEKYLIDQESSPSISYVGQKGYVSTDEPPVEVLDSLNSGLALARKPIYEELIKELRLKRIKENKK